MKIRIWPAAFPVLAIGLAYFGAFVPYGLNLSDEGTVLAQIERLADGEQLYLDFNIGYSPGFYYLHAWTMRLFGHSVVPIRWLLATTNAATMVCLYLLVARVSRRVWVGIAAALFYLAMLPVHVGHFASFNVPYPVWYNALFWLSGFLCLLRYYDERKGLWLLASGVLAGLDFAFKPNVGLFHLAAASLAVLSLIPLQPHGDAPIRRSQLVLWWAWWLAILAGIGAVFAGGSGVRELWIFVVPAVVAALLVAWRAAVLPVLEDPPGVVRSALLLGGGFLAVNAPWLLHYYFELGSQHFLERVLFFGVGLEDSYFIAHPLVLPTLVPLAALTLAAMVQPRRLEQRNWSPPVVLVGAVCVVAPLATAVLAVRPMPEGFYNAVMSQVELRVFAAAVFVHWVGLIVWARTLRPTVEQSRRSFELGVLCLAATFLYMQVYPRSDFMHWARAIAATAGLGMLLLAMLAERWNPQRSRISAAFVAAIVVGPLALVCILRCANGLAALFDHSGGLPRRAAAVRLETPKAPVWSNIGKAGHFRDLQGVIDFLGSNTASDERVFYFPSLEMVSFLSDRRNSTRHGYFYPGWPGREVEAEVVATLATAPPNFIVVAYWHPLYFANAATYYYALGEFVERNYRRYATFGRYAVLRHRKLGPYDHGPDLPSVSISAVLSESELARIEAALGAESAELRLETLAELEQYMVEEDFPPLTRMLADQEQRVRDRAVWALRNTHDPLTAKALLAAVRGGTLSGRETVLALRVGGQWADHRSLAILLDLQSSPVGPVAETALSGLFSIAAQRQREAFWFGADAYEPITAQDLELTRAREKLIRRWLATPRLDFRMSTFAVLASQALPDDVAVPLLHELARRNGRLGPRLAAVYEIARRGDASEFLEFAINALPLDPVFAPRVLQAVAAQTEATDEELAEAIAYGPPLVRVEAAWVAGVLGGKESANAAAQLLAVGSVDARKAAAWALGSIGDERHRELLTRASNDADTNLRAIAGYALRMLADRSH